MRVERVPGISVYHSSVIFSAVCFGNSFPVI